MKTRFLCILFFATAQAALSQAPEVKFIADTLVVQADGTYETDPDLATMTFSIFSQEKEMKQAYAAANQSIERIATLAAANGLSKTDVSTGVLTVAPIYEGDRKKRAKSYYVQGRIVLKIRDFSHIGPILDRTVDDGIADFRSLTYSLSDEEAAKKQAVAEAMRRAIGRAKIALEQKGQTLGALRYMSLDVEQVYGVAQLEGNASQLTALTPGASGDSLYKDKTPPPPPPPSPPQPEKITATASVQCAFQIQ